MKYTAVGEYVVVKPDVLEEEQSSGLVLPEGVQENIALFLRGTVVSLGEYDTRLSEGDRVLYGKIGGFDLDGGLRILARTAILCIESPDIQMRGDA